MKKISLLLLILAIFFAPQLLAQNNRVVGPAEKRITDSLCGCITRLDQSKITNSKEATDAFIDCFSKQSALLEDVTAERKVNMDDNGAMHDLGVDIGKNLLKEKCGGFMQLAVKMAQKNDAETNSIAGTFKKVETKGFNYLILTDNNGEENSFLWLKQFPGSEKFMNGGLSYVGKKVRIKYQEIEVYLPQAKGYYKVKEIVSLTVE